VSTSAGVQLPARRIGPFGAILVRVAIAFACVVAVALIVYIERDGYRDVCREIDRCSGASAEIGWLDALYYATVSLSTTGYGDITPVTEGARLVNIVVITPLRFLFLIVLVGTTVEVLTQRSRDEYRVNRWRKRVQDHTVIVGFGVKGRSAAQALIDGGVAPSSIVVVTTDRTAAEEATNLGAVAVVGDATRDDVMHEAKVDTASKVVVATDRDDTTILVVLTARRLSGTATIVASARESQNIAVIKQSGASTVIPTAESAGRMLGLSLTSPVAGQLVEDLLEPVEGLEIMERDITPAELGVHPESLQAHGELVLAVVRGDVVHRFDERTVSLLQKNDRVVVIRTVPPGQ
jgi:voltage-gated potassium channel